MIRTAHQPPEISITKEVMPAKGKMKILSTKKYAGVEMEPMNVDNSPIFTENSKSETLRYQGQAIMEFTFQSWEMMFFIDKKIPKG